MLDNPTRHKNDTRIWYTNGGVDIHLEKMSSDIMQSFAYSSLFDSGNYTQRVSVQNETNTYRFDLMGATEVMGRKAGTPIVNTKIANDKQTVVVDTMEYNRVTLDWMDNWTSPDRIKQIGTEKGVAMAYCYDMNHLVTLIKAGDYKPDAVLKESGNFHDGVSITIDGFSTYDEQVQAEAIIDAHAYVVNTMIKRRVPTQQLVTFVSTEWYSILAKSQMLTNVQYQGNKDDNNFVHRRVMYINGVKVVEVPLFLNSTREDAPLGEAFNLEEKYAKANMIVFNPATTLLTVDAQPLQNVHKDDDKNFAQYLDTYRMYTVALKRGDACAVVHADAAYAPDTSGAAYKFVPKAKSVMGGLGA